MACVQERNGSYRIIFRYRGKQRSLQLGKVSLKEAEAHCGQVDLLLMRVKQGLLEVPPTVEIVDFLLHDGKVPDLGDRKSSRLTLGELRDQYRDSHSNGAIEASTIKLVAIHMKHIIGVLGEAFPIHTLRAADLQRYVNRRAGQKYRGRSISPTTIRKELASLRAAWNWAVKMEVLGGNFPGAGLSFPKTDERLPFMTYQEIDRRIRSGASAEETRELWRCLFLTQAEVDELLEHVKSNAAHDWIYPLICLAAHTGARRSEIIRARVDDVDLAAGAMIIREKKRVRGQRTIRRVPLSPLLLEVLGTWLGRHPGGPHLFCQADVVPRSRKRKASTAEGANGQPSAARTPRSVIRKTGAALTRDEVHDHFRRTLAGSKWSAIRGLHVLRHSFASNCAASGIDQRLIDRWMGHQTEEMRKRYQHQIPSNEADAIGRVFSRTPLDSSGADGTRHSV